MAWPIYSHVGATTAGVVHERNDGRRIVGNDAGVATVGESVAAKVAGRSTTNVKV